MSWTPPPGPASAPDPGDQPAAAARAIDVVKVYGSGDTEVRALDGVSVNFQAERFTAIMGPSGSGKSTLMHCVAGLDSVTSGTVEIDGTDLTDDIGFCTLAADAPARA